MIEANAVAIAQGNAEAAQAVVDAALAVGVDLAVISPGSRNTPLTLAFHRHPEIDVQVVLDERSAGFFALGRSRASGRPVALVCTSGSALANYYPAVVEAAHSQVPLIVLSADRPEELQGRGAPQTMNQKMFFGEFVKGHTTQGAPYGPEDAVPFGEEARRLFNLAIQSNRGPVHLNCAFREPLWLPEAAVPRSQKQSPVPRPMVPRIQRDDIDWFRDVVERSERGVFLCGPYTSDEPTFAAHLFKIAERIGWPVFAEAASGIRFGPDSPVLITAYDSILRSPTGQGWRPECIVRFGHSSTSRALSTWVGHVGEKGLVVVNSFERCYDPENVARRYLRGDPGNLLEQLEEVDLPNRGNSSWLTRWRAAEENARMVIKEQPSDRLWEGAVAQLVCEALPEDGVLHVANSMAIRDVDSFCIPQGRRLQVYVNRGLNGIDGTAATFAGESGASPKAPAILLVGDLAFLHDMASLSLFGPGAATIVVVDNGGGQIFSFLPIARHEEVIEPLYLTPQEISPEQVCQALGVRYTILETLGDLQDSLADEVERDGLGVLIIRVDAGTNRQEHERVWSVIGTRMKALK